MFIRMCVHIYICISCRNRERQCRRYICICVYMWPQTCTCRESVETRTQFVPLVYIYGAYEKLGILCVSHELHTSHLFLMSHELNVRHDLVRAARVCHV